MAIYPQQSHSTQENASRTSGDSAHLTVAVQAVRSRLQQDGLLDNPELQQHWHHIEQLANGSATQTAQEQLKKERQQLLAIAAQMRACTHREALLQTTTTQIQQALRADRALIYRFTGSSAGTVVAESMVLGYTPTLKQNLPAPCFGAATAADYQRQPILPVPDVRQARFSPYTLQTLEKYQVRSSCCAAIFIEGQIWGLLAVHSTDRPRPWQEAEVNLLYQVATELTNQLQPFKFRYQLQQQAQQERVFNKIVEDVRQETSEADQLFLSTCQEVRQLLRADRAIVYRFNLDWTGEVVAESVGRGWVSLLVEQDRDEVLRGDRSGNERSILKAWSKGTIIEKDTYLLETKGGIYSRGKKFTCVNDVYGAGFSPCYIETLEKYQVRAYIIVPIFYEERLWGLLGVYQNSGPRKWQESEVQLMVRLSAPLGVALKQTAVKEQMVEQSDKLARDAKLDLAFVKTLERIWKSLDAKSLFQTVTDEVRQLLEVDRVAIYQFRDDGGGRFIAESVGAGWISLIQAQEGNPTLTENLVSASSNPKLEAMQEGLYNRGATYTRVDDINKAGLPAAYISQLEQYQARAYVMVPVFQNDRLWGLMGAYQNANPREWEQAELNILVQLGKQLEVAVKQAEYVTQLEQQSEQLAEAAERDRAVAKTIDRIRSSSNLNGIFRTATQELRRLLKADRAVVYKFNPDWSGQVVAESVGSGWVSLLAEQEQDEELRSDRTRVENCLLKVWGTNQRVDTDTYLKQTRGGKYAQGQKVARVGDIYEMGFADCYVSSLEKYQVRAYIIVPILQGDKLWGLLGIYQNDGPRQWQESDIDLMSRIATPLGIALQQAEVLERLSVQSEQLSVTAEREKAAKEQLQQRAVQLLSAIQPSFKGDLTVRAPLTEDEMGTIADAYNNTLQSLRKIVVQVKGAADQVGQTSRQSEGAISELSQQAREELAAISEALDRIQSMVNSTKAVASNAQQVELAVQQARNTVEAGDAAMNRTVEGFSDIRQTVAETSQKIKRLGESSQKITKVVNLISNFATQTNLLALNAAIEATRAGEYGRGFAVVADEVRSLARQSEDATSEIEKLVLEIQQETSAVATAMDSGIQQVVSGTNLVNETRQSLNAIVEATAEIGELVAGITQATQAQTQQSQSVTQTMENVAAIARQTSDGATHIATSFQNLLATAEELQANVGQFKVDS